MTQTDGRLEVETVLKAGVSTYTLTVQNTVVVTANSKFFGGAATTFAPSDANDIVTYTVTISDPCSATTISAIDY